MENKETIKPQIFLTDYGSYNEGRQFEFGHWVDLSKFENYEALTKYISDHFKSCDQSSPLFGGIREETMITAFEGFPKSLYWEGGNLDKIMQYLRIIAESDYDQAVFEAYLDYNDVDDLTDLVERISNTYIGEYDSDIDFAEQYYEHEEIPNRMPYSCIDWSWVAKRLDFYSSGGYYFMG